LLDDFEEVLDAAAFRHNGEIDVRILDRYIAIDAVHQNLVSRVQPHPMREVRKEIRNGGTTYLESIAQQSAIPVTDNPGSQMGATELSHLTSVMPMRRVGLVRFPFQPRINSLDRTPAS
jgi:hypothetical protein